MSNFIQPASGVDDMGAGIASGCLKWFGIIAIIVFAILLTLKLLKII